MRIDCAFLQINAYKAQKAAEQRKAEEAARKAHEKERERLERIARNRFEPVEPLGYKTDAYTFTQDFERVEVCQFRSKFSIENLAIL